jgi:micrococcal nuclease
MKRFPRTTLLTVVALIAVAAAALWGDRFPVLERLATTLGSQLTDEVQATEVAGFESSDLEGILGPAEVLRITDGDTLEIELNGQEERVRLIGVDAPELYESRKLELDDEDSPLTQAQIQALGDQARGFTEDFIGAQDVYLEAGFEPRDRYGRLLAYVYLPDPDGDWELEGAWYRQLNFEIVRAGWAETLTVEPNSDYEADYREATLEAQDAGRGIWGEGWVDID